ncbi:immunoglobulin domain-containing protein [Actomonas aquatica]|uniref:Immunoglobulin domain-containing protein n=1 Tax=Actomonas aquatica TaxID=2866162 RepID=A0ABZ1C2N6_9BACT|nr:immunoglobulin domain-containing protein [Opitutus sp. WL0086]WRQ85731.1 immunoglobulin domain-containing protein [Opitutus sp. WL0086]
MASLGIFQSILSSLPRSKSMLGIRLWRNLRSSAVWFAGVFCALPLSAQQITSDAIAGENISTGGTFTVTITGKNTWGSNASQGGITIQIREAKGEDEELSIESVTASGSSGLFERWQGDSLSNGAYTAQYLHVEPVWNNWTAQTSKTLSVRFRANESGTYRVYAKMYLLDSAGGAYTAPTSGTTDHQGEKTLFVGSVTVSDPLPDPDLRSVSISPNPAQVGVPITIQIEAENDGQEAGDYSSITASLYWSDDSDRDLNVSGLSASWADQRLNRNPGFSPIYRMNGGTMTAQNELVEFVEYDWPAGQRREASFQVTPDRRGTLRVRVRVTMNDKAGNHYNDISISGENRNTTDQQGWDVAEYDVVVNPPTRTVTLSLDGTPTGADPENVQWYVGGRTGSGNPAVVTEVPLGSQTVWASHTTNNSSNPWNEAERWIDQTVTVDSPLHFERNLPYATSGVLIKDDQYETLVGESVVPQIRVRNDSGTTRSVTVQARLSRSKSFSGLDYNETSECVSITNGQERTIDLPSFTPTQAGDYFAVYKVTTKNLTGGDKTTDTAHWGSQRTLLVEPDTRTVTLSLDGTATGADPENVQWYIGGRTGSGNPAVVTLVPAGEQTVWASHTTSNSDNPWDESERWIDETVTVDSPLHFVRNLPYATSGVQLKDGNYEIKVGESVIPQIRVRNDSGISRSVSVQARLSRTRNFGAPDYSQTSGSVTIAAGQEKDIDLPAFTPAVIGDYFAVYKVITNNLTGGSKTTDTAHWGSQRTLHVDLDETKDAEIVSVINGLAVVSPGNTVSVTVNGKNTGNIPARFWIGLSYKEPGAGDWPDGWWDVPPVETEVVEPGAEFQYRFENIKLPIYLKAGQYQAVVGLWDGYDEQSDEMVAPNYAIKEQMGFLASWDGVEGDPYNIRRLDPDPSRFDALRDSSRQGLHDLRSRVSGDHPIRVDSKGGRPLNSEDRKIIVLVHGWTDGFAEYGSPTVERDANKDDSLNYLYHKIVGQDHLMDDWSVVRYDWSHDARTAKWWPPLFPNQEDDAAFVSLVGPQAGSSSEEIPAAIVVLAPLAVSLVAMENYAITAAERAYQHGLVLGEEIVRKVGAQNLDRIQFIAHSAGSWAIYSAGEYIKNNSPETEMQFTFLDPFIPDETVYYTWPFSHSFMTSETLRETNLRSPVETLGAVGSEFYFTTSDFTEGSYVFSALSNATTVTWDWIPERDDGITLRVDRGELGRFAGHSGPIKFYSETVSGSGVWDGGGELNGSLVGWKRSLAFNEIDTYTISGVVTSRNYPFSGVGGVTVSTETGQSAVTVYDGTYNLTGVPAGARTVTVGDADYFAEGSASFASSTIMVDGNVADVDFNQFQAKATPVVSIEVSNESPVPGEVVEVILSLTSTGTTLSDVDTYLDVSFDESLVGVGQLSGSEWHSALTYYPENSEIYNSAGELINSQEALVSGWRSGGVSSGSTYSIRLPLAIDSDATPGATVSLKYRATIADRRDPVSTGSGQLDQQGYNFVSTTLVVAEPEPDTAVIVLQRSPFAGGDVVGGGVYDVGSIVSISAEPSLGYRFVRWSDGHEAAERSVEVVSSGITLIAEFEPLSYTVSASASPSEGGSVVISPDASAYTHGQMVEFTAIPHTGMKFDRWAILGVITTQELKTQNPLSIGVTADMEVIAHFSEVDAGPPSLESFDINGGGESTRSRTVTLNHVWSGGVPDEYRVSENENFVDSNWLPYMGAPVFMLSSELELKTVYLQLRNGNGISMTRSDSITLSDSPDHPLVEKVSELPVRIIDATMAAMGDSLFIFGGRLDGASSGSAKVFRWNTDASLFTESSASLPYGMGWGLSSAAAGDGKIYLGPARGPSSGGGWGSRSRIVEFDPAAPSAAELAVGYPENTWDVSAASDGQGNVYFFGGHNGSNLRSIYQFNAVSGMFESVGQLPWAANSLYSVYDELGGFYLISWGNRKVAYYDPSTRVVTELADIPAGYVVATLGDLAWVDSEQDCYFILREAEGTVLSLFKLNAADASLVKLDEAIPEHLNGGAATRQGDYIYLLGGDASAEDKSYLYRLHVPAYTGNWKPTLLDSDISNEGVTAGIGPVDGLPSWEFDGSSYLSGPSDHQIFGDTPPMSHTVLMAFKTTTDGGTLFGTYDSGGYDGFTAVDVAFANGKLGVGGRYSSSGHVGWVITQNVENSYNDGEWHTFAVTLDQENGVARLFLDGQLQGSETISSTADYTDGGILRFGATRFQGQLPHSPFTGSLSGFEVRASVMSEAEILNWSESLVPSWDLVEVVRYSFENSLDDALGELDGQSVGGDVQFVPGPGEGLAMQMPNIPDHRIAIPVFPLGDESFVVSAWVRMESEEAWFTNENDNRPAANVLTYQTGDFAQGFILGLAPESEAKPDRVYSVYDPGDLNNGQFDSRLSNLYGRWIHLASAVDVEANQRRLYVNGSLVEEAAINSATFAAAEGFIGAYKYSSARNGNPQHVSSGIQIDELRVFTGTASIDDIRRIAGQALLDEHSPRLPFTEDWESGEINLEVWHAWGSPASVLKSDGNVLGIYSFNNNGDANWHSGVTTQHTFEVTPGLVVASRVFTASSGAGSDLSSNTVGLDSRDLSVFVTSGEGVSTDPLLPYVHHRGNGTVHLGDTPSAAVIAVGATVNEWHEFSFRLNENGSVTYYMDGSVIHTSAAGWIDYSSTATGRLVLQGRSVGVVNLVDDVSITTAGDSLAPPAIGTQPESQTVAVGAEVTLSVAATGEALTYQWRKDETVLPGATSDTLSIPSAQKTDSGAYTVIVSNSAGQIVSTLAQVNVLAPVSIDEQPIGRIVKPGENATFTVVVSGDQDITYQWSKDGNLIPDATESSLVVTEVAEEDQGSYQVVVANEVSSETSDPVSLTIEKEDPPVAFRLSGNGYYSPNGGTAVISVSMNYSEVAISTIGAKITLPNGWAFGSVIGGDYPAVIPSRGTTEMAEFAYFSPPSGSASFDMELTYPEGLVGAQAFDAEALYSISGENGQRSSYATYQIVEGLVPAVTIMEDKLAIAGGSATLEATAEGTPPLAYTWFKDSSLIEGASSPSLVLENVAIDDVAFYSVVVSNPAGDSDPVSASLSVVDIFAAHQVEGAGYQAGGTVSVKTTINYTGVHTPTGVEPISTLGFALLLPDDVADSPWSLASSSGQVGQVPPAGGTTELLEWAWTTLFPSPFEFVYTLNVPEEQDGEVMLTAILTPVYDGMQPQTMVMPDPLVIDEMPSTYCVDTDGDYRISLSELLRVIELYNTRDGTVRTGEYHVDPTTIDGFATGSGTPECPPYHCADTDQDCRFSLSELLRVIELYNYRNGTVRTGEYHADPSTIDGFATGPENELP